MIDTHAHILLPGNERGLNPNEEASPCEFRRQMRAAGVGKAGIMAGYCFHEMILFAVMRQGPFYNNNVYFDLSATAELYVDSPRQDELVWTMQHIGMDQFLFASDFPIFNLAETRSVIDRYHFTYKERRKLLRDNAIAIFDLSLAPLSITC